MMTREQLKGSYSEGEALALYLEVKTSGQWMDFLNTYIDDEDYQIARNALWALTKATDEEVSVFQPILHDLIDKAMHADNSSVRRLTLHLIHRLPMAEEDLRTDFLDFCLEEMQRVDGYPGIQSLCMKLAYRMCSFYPELMDELKRTLESMEIEYYKPAVKSLRAKILANFSSHR